jgi:trehalose-phosphatase
MDHLEDVLSNLPVEVSSGNTIVEIKPQGVSKGSVVETILERAGEAAATAALAAAAVDAGPGGDGDGDGGAAAAAAAAAAGGGEQRKVRFAEAPAAPEFVLCIGDDRSDEDMFLAIENHSAARQDTCKVRRGMGQWGSEVGKRVIWLARSPPQ